MLRHSPGLIATALAAGVVMGAASRAHAERPRWHLDAGLVADVPIELSVGATLETPSRLRLGTALGFMPGAYVDLINATATGAGWYSDSTADLISTTLSQSLVWSVWGGWRPVRKWGLFVDLGYSLIALGGGAGSQDLISASTGIAPPKLPSSRGVPVLPRPGGSSAATASADAEYAIDSTLHMLRVRIGWTWWLSEAFNLQASLGGGFTIASNTQVDPPSESGDPVVDTLRRGFADDSAAYLDDTYGSYVHTPTLAVAAGYRFF